MRGAAEEMGEAGGRLENREGKMDGRLEIKTSGQGGSK
jgi:hypothetical protein